MFQWFRNLFRVKKKTSALYDGCNLCYGSGVVCLPTGNRHFRGPDLHRRCPNGCELTYYGMSKLGAST